MCFGPAGIKHGQIVCEDLKQSNMKVGGLGGYLELLVNCEGLLQALYRLRFSPRPQNRGSHQEFRALCWIAAFGFEQTQRVLPA